MKTQLGISVEADFERDTWTFQMPIGYEVSAGQYYIVPKIEYDRIKESIKQLEVDQQATK